MSAAPPRRAALFFIYVTAVLDWLAFGLIVPVLPKLVEQMLGGDTARAAEVFGFFGTAWALMQFAFSPVLGALSDRFGRRRRRARQHRSAAAVLGAELDVATRFASEQGQLQGALNSLRGVTGLVTPSLYTLTFAHSIDPARAKPLPGAPFLLASALLLVAIAIAAWVTRRGA